MYVSCVCLYMRVCVCVCVCYSSPILSCIRLCACAFFQQQTSQDIQNQRHLANVRERQRTQSLNERFARLRRIVPTMPSDKMSKIHTLRLATYYIHFLSQMLDGQNSMIDQVETVDTAAFVHQLRYAFSVWRMGTTLHTPLEMNNNTPNESGSHQSSSSEQPYNNPYH